MSHPGDITTTNGKVFTWAQSAELARMIFQRFGENLESATMAWNRMLQNNCDSHQFRKLLEYRVPGCVNPYCGCGGTCPAND